MAAPQQLTLGDWARRQRLDAQKTCAPIPAPKDVQKYPAERPRSGPRATSYRSNLAFRRTLEAYLAEAALNRRGGRFYIRMWTVTAADAIAYKDFMKRWNRFVTLAKRQFPGFSCVRVVEVHPGEDFEIPGQPGRWDCISHGLHMHFVADRYYPQEQMQRLANRAALGHVSVNGKTENGSRHTVASVVNYLSKYLRKGLHENSSGLRGRQLWAAVNFHGAVGVRDIVTISRWSVIFHRLSMNEDFTYSSFKTRARIAFEGEILSQLVEGMGFPAVLRIRDDRGFHDWIWQPEKLWRLLQPSEPGHPRYREDVRHYSYLPASLGSGWPGVEKYLEWLNSPDGRVWGLAQNEARIVADRQRQRERQREQRRELAGLSD